MTTRWLAGGYGWLVLLAVCVLACSQSAQRRHAAAVGGGGTGGVVAGSGGAGGVGGSGIAGTGVFDAGLPTLAVKLLADGRAVASTQLDCKHKCVVLSALVTGGVTGGAATHAISWSDTTLQGAGPFSVCPTSATDYRVTIDDAVSVDNEFGTPAMHAEASLHVDVTPCMNMPFGPCDEHAAAGSFDPIEKWHVDGFQSLVTPLVANLTDDNADGKIDLSDTPDVAIVTWDTGELMVFDGATGNLHYKVPAVINESTPAIADIDGDGVPEIVLIVNAADPPSSGTDYALAALDHAGKELWHTRLDGGVPTAIAIADLEHDGTPEIIAGANVFDAQGVLLWHMDDGNPNDFEYSSPAAVDLDGDGVLEVVNGESAYRSDGSVYFANTDVMESVAMAPGSYFMAVADLDGDQQPEIVVTTSSSWFVLDHTGKTLHQKSAGTVPGTFAFPPAIADVDGDGMPEILVSNGARFFALHQDLEPLWSNPVSDSSGIASGTAFDFLGDGSAEAMYADENTLWAFDGASGMVQFQAARSSATVIEYPTVADVDNDGSADIVIVSSDFNGVPAVHGVQVLSDRNAHWVRARRIMNQDTYHVTNINEDGTLPKQEAPFYKANNTFRAQAQIAQDGTVCLPR